MKRYVLSIDQGTTSTRAILFDRGGAVVAMEQKESKTCYPKPGWVEQDAEAIMADVYDVINQLLLRHRIDPGDIASIGITNQRETTVLWNKRTGKPVYHAIVWQSRQTSDICQKWRHEGLEEQVRSKTGLLIDAYFSASKIRWILDHVSGAKELAAQGDLLFGTMDTWLIWNLTGGTHVTDYSNASRTMVYNIHSLCWDEELMNGFGIPHSLMPEVRASSEIYGYARIQNVAIPIAGAIGDQQAALFGQACFQEGDVKITYGTGCFLLMHTGQRIVSSQSGLLSTIAWGLDGKVEYALEGSVFIGGSAVQWLRDGLQIISNAEQSEELASSVDNSEGVYVVPAFVGMGAPYWDMEAQGSIFGLTRGTTKAHIARATLESIAYQTKDVVEAMLVDAAIPMKSMKVDGGASRNSLLMQFQADILGAAVERQAIKETTALGAAYLAGLAVGFWEHTDQIAKHRNIDQVYTPSMPAAVRDKKYKGWQMSVACTMQWKHAE